MALRKTLGALLACLILAFAGTANAQIVISQVYGGGGNAGAPYQNDFVELFNPTAAPIVMTNWTVQYASATGTNFAVGATLNATIGAGEYFLVQMAGSTANGVPLPTPDATGTSSMAGASGNVMLYRDTAAMVAPINLSDPLIEDHVGYGTGIHFEGSGAAGTLSNTTSASRAGGGCVDTDDNAADFTVGAPNPRNSASPTNNCATVTAELLDAYSIAPAVVRAVFDIEPVGLVIGDFTLVDSQSTATISSIDTVSTTVYDLNLSASLTDTLSDSLTYDSVAHNFIGGISDVRDIRQGTITTGNVVTVEVTVTAEAGSNVTAQSTGTLDTANRGIIFFSSGLASGVAVDDDIVVVGEVSPFTDGGGSTRLQLANPILISAAAGAGAAPTVVAAADFAANNTAGALPAEQWEGVLIKVENVEYTVNRGAFGEHEFTAAGPVIVLIAATFHNATTNLGVAPYEIGAFFDITGIGWESFGEYKIQPRSSIGIGTDIELSTTSVGDWDLFD